MMVFIGIPPSVSVPQAPGTSFLRIFFKQAMHIYCALRVLIVLTRWRVRLLEPISNFPESFLNVKMSERPSKYAQIV